MTCVNASLQCTFRPAPTIMKSSNRNIFHVTGPLWGESAGHQWIPPTKASGTELWGFLWSAPEQTVGQTIETPVIEVPSSSLWRHCNVVELQKWQLRQVLWGMRVNKMWIHQCQRDEGNFYVSRGGTNCNNRQIDVEQTLCMCGFLRL